MSGWWWLLEGGLRVVPWRIFAMRVAAGLRTLGHLRALRLFSGDTVP
jgi:hypothetical protein